ncbi:MAG: hypothetical protein RLZZ382_910 [Bacteroidota bacterium]|jgi:hypothetical protein
MLNRSFLKRHILILLLTFSINVIGQLTPHTDPIIERGIDSNRHYRNELSGYRIQLAFDSDKKLIDSLRLKFITTYPKIEAYISFEAPYFNFMVGDYRSEIEAGLFKQQLLGTYPLTVIQRTRIKLPRID